MIRGDYNLKDFKAIDKGVFTQKHINFSKIELTFKGKVKTIKFVLTQRGKTEDDNWLRIKK